MFNTKDVNHAFFDCDDTLVMWDIWPMADVDTIAFEFHGRMYNLVPHKEHIQRLKDHFNNGHVVIVWSAGGAAWANCVVETLGLKQYVTAAISKPQWYYDDLKVQDFMPEMNRVYIKPPVREERFCKTCGTIKVLVEKEPITYRCISCEQKTCKNCNIFVDQYTYLVDDPYCGVDCMFEHKIKIKKEDLPKHRSGVQPTKVMKNKKKYKRKDRYGRKYE